MTMREEDRIELKKALKEASISTRPSNRFDRVATIEFKSGSTKSAELILNAARSFVRMKED
jgi:hypothetical protein